MIVYIEDEVVAKFTSNMIIDGFDIINHVEYIFKCKGYINLFDNIFLKKKKQINPLKLTSERIKPETLRRSTLLGLKPMLRSTQVGYCSTTLTLSVT